MLMDERASTDAVATYLLDVALNHMGLSPSAELATRSAAAARTLAMLCPEFETH
jgi:hypothetical protein